MLPRMKAKKFVSDVSSGLRVKGADKVRGREREGVIMKQGINWKLGPPNLSSAPTCFSQRRSFGSTNTCSRQEKIALTGDRNAAALEAECHPLLHRQSRVGVVERSHNDKLYKNTNTHQTTHKENKTRRKVYIVGGESLNHWRGVSKGCPRVHGRGPA